MAEVTINGVAVDAARFPTPEAAAVHELLRQRALATGLVGAGAGAEALDAAIEGLLAREVATPEPTEAECRQHYAANEKRFTSGELVEARHILFQVTPATPVNALRAKAEVTLSDLLRAPGRFEALARECSNCPSGQHGGNLGQIQRGQTVPEFERALFDGAWTGVRGQLVKTRYGFHIVAVDRRVPGRQLPFETVRERIAGQLRERVQRRALEQYVRVLAGRADVRGVDLGAAATPLVR
ncbi:MAG: peptidylprolyl isomerase [Betaproteobacteria bacterium]|nr:peptidylprolyl isomerase [Betaproteobacteria bacterium]